MDDFITALIFAGMVCVLTWELTSTHYYEKGHEEAFVYIQGAEHGKDISRCVRQEGKVIIKDNKVYCVKEKF